MKWCRPSLVSAAEVHVLFAEEEKADRLISLGGNMHDIKSVEILSIHICSVLDQNRAHLNVSSERGIMQSRELILRGLLVDPICNLALDDIFFGFLQDRIKNLVLILEDRHME